MLGNRMHVIVCERLHDRRVIDVTAETREVETRVVGHLLDHADVVDVQSRLMTRGEQGTVKYVELALAPGGFCGFECKPAPHPIGRRGIPNRPPFLFRVHLRQREVTPAHIRAPLDRYVHEQQ